MQMVKQNTSNSINSHRFIVLDKIQKLVGKSFVY